MRTSSHKSSHWYGFSPVWVRMWRVRLPDSENLFSQISHSKGLSPVWVRMWVSETAFSERTSSCRSRTQRLLASVGAHVGGEVTCHL